MTRVLVEDLPELPADLAGLAHVAAAADQQIGAGDLVPGAAGTEAPPERDRAAEFAGLLRLVVGMAAPMLPFLPACYPEQTCDQIGAAFAAVAEKHGWEFGALESPELALALVSIPPTVAAVMAGRAHFAALRLANEQREADARRPGAAGALASPPPAPAAPTYSPGHLAATS